MQINEIGAQETHVPKADFIVDFEARSYLLEAGKWAKFLAIVGFVFCGLIVALLLVAVLTSSAIAGLVSNGNNAPFNSGGFLAFIPILLILLIYFFFVYYLYQFASKVKKGITHYDTAYLTGAMGSLKSFFKYWAILCIVMVLFYAVLIIVVIIGAIASGAWHH